MFRRIDEVPYTEVSFTFDGQEVMARKGENLAAALLIAGLRSIRSTWVSGEQRAPYCMMGACYDCLVEIDGETVQACMTPIEAGLNVKRISGKADD